MISAIILAAGKSTRMGEQKLLLPFESSTVFERVIYSVKSSGQFGEIIAVVSPGKLYTIALKNKIQGVINENPELGLSRSIRLGVGKAHKDTEAFMFFSGDQPEIRPESIGRIVECYCCKRRSGKSIVVPQYNNRNGMPTIFDAVWKKELTQLSGDTGGRELIKLNQGSVDYIQIEDDMEGLDIDTKEDYAVLTQKSKSRNTK